MENQYDLLDLELSVQKQMDNQKTTVSFKNNVRLKIREGIDVLENAVGSTLGARGKGVAINRGYEQIVIRDGVSVARGITLKDNEAQSALAIMREAAQKTVDMVGDGTTATIIMAHAIYTEGEKRIAAGIDPREFVEEIEADIKACISELEKKAIPVKTLEQKIQIATISCEEKELGEIIGKTIDEVGDDGVVTVDKSKTGITEVDMQKGMQWDRGLASPYFITDPNTMTATIEDSPVFVTDYELNTMKDILPLIKDIVEVNGKRFFTIIAPEFGGDVLPSLLLNKQQGTFLCICIKAPSFGGQQTNMLQDIAVLTGGTFISKEQGHKLEDVRFEHLGYAEKISASQTTSLVSGGKGDKKAIDERIKTAKALLKDETSEFERERLKERIAKLGNGVAVIKVGGNTDIEIKERFERALDSALATRQAVKKGIIPGGEVAYLSLRVKSDIVKKALQAPFKRLMSNAGFDPGQMLERILKEDQTSGIDVTDGKIKDMLEVGIIDPVACAIEVLKNASSVACTLLITETLITNIDKENK